jgi:2,4-dienoyl-CoA reductase (NADPH2)
MGSMHTGLEEHPDGMRRMARFYAERARGGVGLIVTGGIAPNPAGRVMPGARVLASSAEAGHHREVTAAVHAEGGRIALQILHTGRYAMLPGSVAPSAVRAPISPFTPHALSAAEIEETIEDFVRCAQLAREAGYDGVEVMGSEGYLINQFIAPQTNLRDDDWGGDFARRSRFPIEIVRRMRARLGPDFLIIYRLSMLDLVPGGSTADEVGDLAVLIEQAGATLLNTGIGWHEARIPTIATCVPRGGFAWVTARLRGLVDIPLIATNRINTPEVAEAILARGDADMVSMARPFLADAEFVAKSARGQPETINTCIGCNQACLDHVFSGKLASCLVNPRACREHEFSAPPAAMARRVAVVGAGPAGLACASEAAVRGHHVTLFEAAGELGGQFNLARRVPGKEEFGETLRYFATRLTRAGADIRLSTTASAEALCAGNFDEIVLATGVAARTPAIPGIDHPMVVGYADLLAGRVTPGQRIAIIGAGGIGFDVAEFLTCPADRSQGSDGIAEFLDEWGIAGDASRGGLGTPGAAAHGREVTLLQRKPGKPGEGLGKSTGWIHRTQLRNRGVVMLAGVHYIGIDHQGLHLEIEGTPRLLAVDQVVVCAGQEARQELLAELAALGRKAHLIGGSAAAAELDARRAIEEGTRLALQF